VHAAGENADTTLALIFVLPRTTKAPASLSEQLVLFYYQCRSLTFA
jgi:hypothetical protein